MNPPSPARDVERVRAKFAILKIALWTLAAALWGLLIAGLGGRLPVPFGHLLVPIVLCGLTGALHRLLKNVSNSWAVSAIIAPVLAVLVLALIAFVVRELDDRGRIETTGRQASLLEQSAGSPAITRGQ